MAWTLYLFTSFSATTNNTKSTNSASNDILLTEVNQMSDIIISSLRLEEEDESIQTTEATTADTNNAGERLAGTYVSSDPTFLWDVGFQSNSVINLNMTGIGYRVSIREPSTTNTPSKNIYHEPDVQLTGRFGDLKYTFPFDTNRTLPAGPHRNFDIVVEAVDTHFKKSAAGGYYENPVGTSVDSDFSNSFSYDIFSATNPRIDDFKLTDPTLNVTSRYNTEQWITADGGIKLWVKDNIPPDWEGGFAYVWTGFTPFRQEEAYGKFDATFPGRIATDKNIIRLTFAGSGENGLISIPTGITGYMSAYMSVSPADSFDLAKYDDGILTDGQLAMSNVVKIQKRLGFNEKLLYHAWAETEINYNNQNVPADWTNYAVGIKSIVCEPYSDVFNYNSTKFKWNFNFETPLPNTNYVVVATNTGDHIVDEHAEIIKYSDKVQFYRFNGKQFFGIQYNGNII